MTRAATLMLAATGIIAGTGAARSSNGLRTPNVATSSYIHAGLFPDSTNAPIAIDAFENIDHWKATPSDGVRLALAQDAGLHGKSMRLDFDFQGHGGYAVIHRDVDLNLPSNYEFSFDIRGDAPVNTLERRWSNVARAFAFMDSLRQSRMTPEYRTVDKRAFYGLLPQSISHEGYSAKPMHSYWDDLFALRGFKDAAEIARVLRKPEAMRYAAVRDEFRKDLYESMKLAMTQRHIDYIPGSVELGDFDATSTTIGVSPVDELGKLPQPALDRTFQKYYESSKARLDGKLEWDAYTPYELRAVGTLVRLGQKERAHELLDFFFQGQRPKEWRQWAEVVWHDPRAPKFIGDMPHTWVGSDYIRSVLDMFAYERESDSSLVIGAGIPESWVRQEPGVHVRGLSTHYGRLSYAMTVVNGAVRMEIEGVRVPPGGLIVRSPLDRPLRGATLNGKAMQVRGSDVLVRTLPASVVLRY